MVANTRLKESDREATIKTLQGILNNVPRFIEMPIREKSKWSKAWNSKFPADLFQAMELCENLGYGPQRYYASTIRFTIKHEGKFYSTPIKLNWLSGEYEAIQPIQVSPELRKTLPGDAMCEVKVPDGTVYLSAFLTVPQMHEFLGEPETESFIEWIVATSLLRVELTEAYQTINDIFSMAKTAGQVKRMVPDLLQYLPVEMRKAYENQIRASSLPFEWAPYPRDRVEKMIVAVGKGHLLSGMNKSSQSNWDVTNLKGLIWGSEVTVTKPMPDSATVASYIHQEADDD